MESSITTGIFRGASLVFMALAALSGWLVLGEWRVVAFSPRAGALVPAVALSASSDSALLDGCLTTASSVEGRLLPQGRATLLAQCLQVSEEITSTSPQDAYGWFVQAYFALETGDFAGFSGALARSYSAGPNEQWIAALRVRIAEQNFGSLSDAALAGHRADLALMVQSPRGRGAMAARYIMDAGFRSRITAVVETLPAWQQQIFISTLRGASGNG